VPVQYGIDVLALRRYALLRGKRVGLITNHTGVDAEGKRTAEHLHQGTDFRLSLLFSPEHGLLGTAEDRVADGLDPQTNVPVVSLYGGRLQPDPKHLQELDVLVFDIQDVGVRFYTYISTLGLCLQAAAKARIPFVVLDRPNPLGGCIIEGPLADAHHFSFTAWHNIPIRHGMTVGELARMYNAERQLGAQLTVVPCRGWKRTQWFPQTGLTWIGPSPNLATFLQTVLYPGIALLETTNVSVGRGTHAPFEQVGAPWLDGVRLVRYLERKRIPGARFLPVRFVPKSPPYTGEVCSGVQVVLTRIPYDARRQYPCLRIGMEIAAALRDLFPNQWDSRQFLHLLANDAAYDAFLAGASYEELAAMWQSDGEAFRVRREPYLLYPRRRNN